MVEELREKREQIKKMLIKKAEELKILNKIAKQEKIGTEEMGRKARYEFFNKILKKENANKIATAHTKNDLAETVLMNLLRGTGLSGLKGIEPKRENKYIKKNAIRL